MPENLQGKSGPETPETDRLDSWKEIATYLKRDISTVQRWEKREGLPVHRHVHAKLGSLYAFKSELDAWWRDGHDRIDPPEPAGGETSESQSPSDSETRGSAQRPRAQRWLVLAGGGLLALALTTTWIVAYRMGARGRDQAPTQSPPSFLTLTSRRGYIPQARFAPDGQTVVYSAAWNGRRSTST